MPRQLELSVENSLVSQKAIKKFGTELAPAIAFLHKVTSQHYEQHAGAINLCRDTKSHSFVERLARHYTDVALVVVCGIGGSNLGTMAVQEALLGKLHNIVSLERNEKPLILYADTTDAATMRDIRDIMEVALRGELRVLLNISSKSGTTTETIANAEILIDLIKKYDRDWQYSIVITTDHASKLWQFAEEHGIPHLDVPEKIGGRYSVLSPVGLFPLNAIGIDTHDLLAGARDMLIRCLEQDITDNPAALSAVITYHHVKDGRSIVDSFFFANNYESLGKWYRQLAAESLGKEFDKKRKRVRAGFTPTVSIGSTDLHSVGQLVFAGPQDKHTCFVTVQQDRNFSVPYYPEFNSLVPGIQDKPLADILGAIASGTMSAYQKHKLPFVHVPLPENSAYMLGQFIQFKMMETMYLAHLFGVNAFDQPAVESYKTETRKHLR